MKQMSYVQCNKIYTIYKYSEDKLLRKDKLLILYKVIPLQYDHLTKPVKCYILVCNHGDEINGMKWLMKPLPLSTRNGCV